MRRIKEVFPVAGFPSIMSILTFLNALFKISMWSSVFFECDLSSLNDSETHEVSISNVNGREKEWVWGYDEFEDCLNVFESLKDTPVDEIIDDLGMDESNISIDRILLYNPAGYWLQDQITF